MRGVPVRVFPQVSCPARLSGQGLAMKGNEEEAAASGLTSIWKTPDLLPCSIWQLLGAALVHTHSCVWGWGWTGPGTEERV